MDIRAIQDTARKSGVAKRPRWPVVGAANAQGLDRTEGSGPARKPKARGARIRCDQRYDTRAHRDARQVMRSYRRRSCLTTAAIPRFELRP